MTESIAIGSGNVFRDLGYENPEEHQTKADLVSKIASVIRERRLTQMQTAQLIGVVQPTVSRLVRGNFKDFSIERLCRILNTLGVSVSLVLTDEQDWKPGSTTVAKGVEES